MNTDVIAVMPIKLHSERVREKNFRPLGDLMLFEWALNKVAEIVSDVRIFGTAETYQRLSGDWRQRLGWIEEEKERVREDSLDFFREIMQAVPDAKHVMVFHATSPFVSQKTYQACLDAVIDGTDVAGDPYDSALTVTEHRGWFWRPGRGGPIGDPTRVPRSQTLEPIYRETSSCWVVSPELVLSDSRRVGYNPYFRVVEGIEALDIDTDADFESATATLSRED